MWDSGESTTVPLHLPLEREGSGARSVRVKPSRVSRKEDIENVLQGQNRKETLFLEMLFAIPRLHHLVLNTEHRSERTRLSVVAGFQA